MSHANVHRDDRWADRLGLRAIAEAYINDQYFAAHASDDLAAEALLDQFKRAVRQELEMLECRAVGVDPTADP